MRQVFTTSAKSSAKSLVFQPNKKLSTSLEAVVESNLSNYNKNNMNMFQDQTSLEKHPHF